jgi:O-antigen ligase
MVKRVGILIGLISVVTSPWTTYDPINPLKFALLSICGLSCFVFMILSRKRLKVDRVLIALSTIFLFQALISMVFSGASLTDGFFGHYGRNFGFFTWLMLFATMLYLSTTEKTEFFLKVLLLVGGMSFLYSILQYFGKDPAPWDNYYGPIVGFLGNPNFQSSFLGLFFIAMCGNLLKKIKSIKNLAFFLPVALGAVFLILVSRSIQGVFVAVVGTATYLFYFLFARKLYASFWTLVVATGVLISMFTAAVVGAGPLATFLHQGTLAIRGDYWVTAISMARSNWFTGVGPDQYGTWYRFYRENDALTRINAEVTSDSAHNGYLDFAANLGIFALLVYLLILIYALFIIGKYIKSQDRIDYTHASLVALFVGFQSQFLISPNQIGLVIWGWVFLGLIFGHRKTDIVFEVKSSKNHSDRKSGSGSSNSYTTTASLLLGTIIGIIISGPIVYSSMQFRSALVKADALQVIKAANIWPRNDAILNYSTTILLSNNLQEQGFELLESGVEEFPNSYDLWLSMLNYKWITKEERMFVQAQLHRLDPLNPKWQPSN